MKLRVLVDNNTFINMYYLGEPAVSYYIEDKDINILFDTGYSRVYIDNAKKLNINLHNVDKIILSHGHDDHTGGLTYYFKDGLAKDKLEVITHPESLNFKEDQNEYIGSSMNKEELEKVCKLILSKNPFKVSENIIFLGEIPQSNEFERKSPIGKCRINNEMVDDLVSEDSAIVYKSDKGLFIITGCSHSGICNIIEYAKKICNTDKVYGVIGGFHLFDIDERLERTITYLKDNNIELLYPCHCISLKAKIEMGKQLNINEVGVGLELDI